MKRILLFALCAMVSLAGCQRIDETGNTPEPEESTLKVTAVITDNSTKVTYDVVDNTVKPKWAVGDQIFGFTTDGTFNFEVTAVSESGTATFSNGGFAPADGTTLYAVYYPGKGVGNFVDNTLAVDVTSQSGSLDGTAPAIMCATATAENGEVNFHFYNQTAIIGVKKFQTNPEELITTFKASGFVATGSIEVVDNELTLVPGTTTSDITINCEYTADTEGMYDTPVYFVTVPTEGATIDIEATSSKGTEGIYSTPASVIAGDILAGNYYYMSKKLASEHVARYTNDGGDSWTYTESLAAAISGIATTTAKENGKVELLKDHKLTAQIAFESLKFTLDGNGHTITVPSLAEATSIFPKNSSDVTFKNVTIKGPGTAPNRAIAVETTDNVILDDCIIKDFNNPNNGGAIYCKNSTITITGESKIENCHSTNITYGGGAIFSENGTVTIGDYVTISGCSAGVTGGAANTNGGGALYLYGSTKLTMGSATITNCKTNYGAAGAIWVTGTSQAEITGATITDCTATGGNAGCLLINNANASVEMTDCTVSECTSTSNGGAFRAVSGSITFKDGLIEKCSAAFGGGISNGGGTVELSGTTLSGCTNGTSGGTVYMTAGSVKMTKCSVSGGNTYLNGAGTFTFDNSTYDYQASAIGNAFYVTGTATSRATLAIKNNSLINSKGIDICAGYGTVTCDKSDFIGGGLYCVRVEDGGKLTFTESRGVNTSAADTAAVFKSNTTKNSGDGAANLVVKSGYYSGKYIARRLKPDTYTSRIFIYDGCYTSTNKVMTKICHNGTTSNLSGYLVKLGSPVKQTISGKEYTFNYIVQTP